MPTGDDVDLDNRFRDIWMYCLVDHGEGTLPSGPCDECIARYAKTGPPDGEWNQ